MSGRGNPRVTLSQAKRSGAAHTFRAGRTYADCDLELELTAALYQQRQRHPSTFDQWAAKRRQEWAAAAKDMEVIMTSTDVACPYCANPNEKELPLNREFLNDFRCPDPGCTCSTIGFSPNCHPDAGHYPYYCRKHGTLALFCQSCGLLRAVFEIAKEKTHAGR